MTQSEYLEDFIEQHGEDYVEELIAQGFELIHTSRGWRWIMGTRTTIGNTVTA